ncbi:MAG: LysR family transcriptional regulator, partial [Rhodoferax sp.]
MSTSDPTPQLLNRLRMRQVSLLLAIEQHGTLRGASEALGLTQPGATKMLHELED